MNNPGIDFPWLRWIKVTFEGLSGGGNSVYESDGTQETARIVTRVEKTIQSLPAATNLMMYNLSENTRNSFVRGQTKVRIEAGWKQGPFAGLKQCFYGSSVTSFSQRAGSDIVTSINAISMAEDLTTTSIFKTWGPGTSVESIVKELAGKLKNIKEVRVKDITAKVSKGGWTHSDTVRNALERLSAEFGFSWNICDGVFQALKDKKTFGGNTVIKSPYLIDINPVFTGPGSEQIATGLRIRSTFNATVIPMFNVGVQSVIEKRFNSGSYIVQSVVHNLDCWNKNSFISEINTLIDPASARAINGF